jgi:predicted DNA-binding protein (UPF0251 family)
MRLKVLTQKKAADKLKVSRHEVAKRLADGTLTVVDVDDRPAVLVDRSFSRFQRAAATRKAA